MVSIEFAFSECQFSTFIAAIRCIYECVVCMCHNDCPKCKSNSNNNNNNKLIIILQFEKCHMVMTSEALGAWRTGLAICVIKQVTRLTSR